MVPSPSGTRSSCVGTVTATVDSPAANVSVVGTTNPPLRSMYSADSTMLSVTGSAPVLLAAGRVRVNVTSSPSAMLSASAAIDTAGASLSRMRTSNCEALNVTYASGKVLLSPILKSSVPSTRESSTVLMLTRFLVCRRPPSNAMMSAPGRTTVWVDSVPPDSSRRRKSVR